MADSASQVRPVSLPTTRLRWRAQSDSFLEHYRPPRHQQILANPAAVGIARSDKGAMLTLYLQAAPSVLVRCGANGRLSRASAAVWR